MSTLEERVWNGVRWLNENLGPDWPEFIDRETLRMDSPFDCVLGQLFRQDDSIHTGFWWVIGLMAMVATSMGLMFWRRQWLGRL